MALQLFFIILEYLSLAYTMCILFNRHRKIFNHRYPNIQISPIICQQQIQKERFLYDRLHYLVWLRTMKTILLI